MTLNSFEQHNKKCDDLVVRLVLTVYATDPWNIFVLFKGGTWTIIDYFRSDFTFFFTLKLQDL